MHWLNKYHDSFEIISRLKKHRVLKFKLEYILLEQQSGKFDLDIRDLFKTIVEDLQKGLLRWDLNLLQHATDLFLDLKENHPKYVAEYEDYAKDVEDLLTVSFRIF